MSADNVRETDVEGGQHVWSRRFGGISTQDGWSIASDTQSNVLVAGSFHDKIDFGGGPLESAGGADIFLLKLDPSGQHIWSRHFGGGGGLLGQSIAVDGEGNVALLGATMSPVDAAGNGPPSRAQTSLFLSKLDPSGKVLFTRRYEDHGYQTGQVVSFDPEGNIVIAGTFLGAAGFGGERLHSAGLSDVFVAKLGPDGQHLWSKAFGDAGYQRTQGLAVDAGGNVILTGTFEGTMSFGGAPLTSVGQADIFVTKLSPSGDQVWSRRFGDSEGQGGQSIAVDRRTGSIILAGYFSGMIDFGNRPLFSTGRYTFFLAKLSGEGAHVWSGSFGSTTGPYNESIAVDRAGNVLLTGPFEGMVDFGGGPLSRAGSNEILVAKLDEHGTHIWSRCFGEASDKYGQNIAVDEEGNPLLVGSFSGKLDFGGGPLVSQGGYDIFVLKLSG